MESDQLIGQVIEDEYEIEALIGRGGFGVVYLAKDRNLGDRRVAMKMLNVSAQEKEMDRFLAEGRILASVDHPNVVRIYRLGYHQSRPFIVMEYLGGHTLREVLIGERLSVGEGMNLARQIASGLGAIHDKGIVHRDLSANNIMVTSGTAKILDLGLAKDMKALSTVTKEGYLVGTVAYVSPEQIEGKGASLATDIFSCGVLLYEILAGHHPFEAEHYMSMLYKIANNDPLPLDKFLEDPPPKLVALVEQALNKDPQKRPAHSREIERALNEIQSDNPAMDSTVRLKMMDDALVVRDSTPHNPYLNRAMLRHWADFFGRKHEVRKIFARLNATPPGSVSLVGDRKIGKSSLMNYVYLRQNRETYLEAPEQMIMVFLDLQEEKQMSIENFVKILIRMCQYELRDRLDVSGPAPTLDGVKTVVETLHRNGYRLAILLDEFDAVTANPNFDLEFFAFLRYLANHYNVSYLTSSMRDLQTLCHTDEISDSPFFNIFSTLRLGAFRREEAQELVRLPSERAGRPLAPYTDRILEAAGLFPFFLQIACAHALDYMDDNPDREEPDFDEIYRRFCKEAAMHYRYLWTNLESHERSTIQRLALGKRIPESLEHVLTDLEARDLVGPSDRQFELFSRSFAQFVREEGKRDSKPSVWKRITRRG